MLKGEFPGLGQAVFLTAAVVALQVAVMFPIAQWPFAGGSLADHPFGLVLANTVAFGIVLLYALGRSGVGAAELFQLRPMPVRAVAPIVVATLGLGVLLSDLDNLFRYFVPVPAEIAEAVGERVDIETSLFGVVFVLVVVAPLTEELLFRGVIFRGLVRRYDFWPAALLSAALFALAHFNPWQLLTAMCLGVLFAWFVQRSGTIGASLIGHAVHNGSTVAVGALPVDVPGYTSQPADAVVFQPLWLNAAGLAIAVAGLMWFRRVCASSTQSPER